MLAAQLRQHSASFGGSEDDRKFWRARHALDVIDEIEFSAEHLLIKKEQGTESLILSRRGDVFIDCEMIQELSDLRFAHFVRMAFAMEQNEPANPIDVRFLRSNGIAFRAQLPADAIEQFR